MPATPVVYIDVVFVVNFVMDGVLLWTTGWLLKRSTRFRRVALGALLGAGYGLCMFFPILSLLTTWPGKALMSVAMVFIALPHKGMLDLLRQVVVFFFVSFVFAGAAVALGFAIPSTSLGKGIAVNGHGLMFATSGETLALMAAVPICVFGIQRLMMRLRRVQQRSNWIVAVAAKFGDVVVQFDGLLDSGNQLYDPVSKCPVSFVDMDILLPVLPEDVRGEIAKGTDLLTAVATLAASTSFRLVPFQGASGKGLTVALRPDEVTLQQNGERLRVRNAQLLAVYPGTLSSDGTFQAILHMDMMNGDDEVESTRHTQGPQYEIANSPPVVLSTHSRETPRQS
ncbi:sporulation sigma-E factor-processing peptidase [Alicyclobacillus acidoterrestris]|uniref:sigma-E processing peptidase SpoIIGA n=1 Tax=Alicyclobacillus suci TaxID=2816080 RepID=UPI001195AF70|nr:sigma-E processing peptidase SpoIIGA [Alicyclobacillus suci]GEO25091.1 sporulation sigma-E factor-processing peptidase [Alicyclobacillus acidoterrestris]